VDKQFPRVLLVEDNRVNQQVMLELLEQLKTRVTLAINGLEALACIEKTHFDLIFMDIQMPQMDGMTATSIIRRDHPEIPIIATTGNALHRDRQEALDAGMSDFVAKPISSYQLYETLRRWIPWADLEPISNHTDSDFPPLKLGRHTAIDTQQGIAHVGNNKSLYIKLLHDFIQDHHNDLDTISVALSNSEFKTVERIAHTIASIAANIAAAALYKSSRLLDASVRVRNTEAIDLAFQRFSTEFNQVMVELKQYEKITIGTLRKNRQESQAREQPMDWLLRMDRLLSEGDAEAIDLLSIITDEPELLKQTDRVNQLSYLIHRFQFDDARQVLAEMGSELEH